MANAEKLMNHTMDLKFTAKSLQRQARKCEEEEKTEKLKFKKAIEKGNMDGARIYAENSIRKCSEQMNYLRLASRLDAVVARLESLGSIVKSLDSALASGDLQKMSETMHQFESQFVKMEFQAEFIEGAMAGSTNIPTPESNANSLMQQVADDYGLELSVGLPQPAAHAIPSSKENEKAHDFVSPPKRAKKVGPDNCKNQDASPVIVTNGAKMKTSEVPKDEIMGDQTGDYLHGGNLPSQSADKRGTVPESKEAMDNKCAEQVRASTNANAFVGSKSRAPQVSSSISYPDPQFYDFDIARNISKFAVNQIWAVYDESDGMPRRYALIQKVFSPGFKLQYTWLEYNPTSTAEGAWVDAGQPIACGNFRPGKKLCAGNSLETFSHLILFEEVIRGNTYNIYPKKGEVWALFKEWDVGWSSATEPPKKYDYEFVEVISDLAYGKNITVSHLVKVKGFLYLFMQAHDKGVTVIPSGQLLKFSHRIPHYNICGEREGIPRNSFELDPAALPQSFVNVTDSFNAETAEVIGAHFCNPCSKPRSDEHKLAGGPVKNKGLRSSAIVFETASRKTRGSVCGNSDDILDKSDVAREQLHVSSEAPYVQSRRFEAIEHNEGDPCKLNADNNDESDEDPTSNKPEFAPTEFWDFDEERSEEKFKKGQIWALYNEVGEYPPNYYALLRKADWEVNGFVNLKWLEFSPKTEEGKLWAKNGLPFACGRFKVVQGTEEQDNIHVFSHMVHAKLIKYNVYDIYPNTGEVWAVFKNLNVSWTSTDLEKNADYSVVEIIELDKDVVKALLLSKVKGYNYVFKAEARDVTDIQIPLNECSRFSHRVPAFRLTNQESGKLRDFWELDPDSIPNNLLTTDF